MTSSLALLAGFYFVAFLFREAWALGALCINVVVFMSFIRLIKPPVTPPVCPCRSRHSRCQQRLMDLLFDLETCRLARNANPSEDECRRLLAVGRDVCRFFSDHGIVPITLQRRLDVLATRCPFNRLEYLELLDRLQRVIGML